MGKRLVSAECPAWSALTSQPPIEAHDRWGAEVQAGETILSGPPVKASPWPQPMTCLVSFQRRTLMATESHAMGCGGAPRQCGASLGFTASGVSRVWACILPRPGGAGGGPIRAPSQNLPLPLVTAASRLCLAQVQPPHTHPHSGQQSRPPNLPGLGDIRSGEEGLSRPQFPHLRTRRIGLCLWALPLQDPGTNGGTLGSELRLPVFPLVHPTQGTECSAQRHLGCAATVRLLPL